MPARVPTAVQEPPGLIYRPEFITPEEERGVLAVVEGLDFASVVMHGQAAKRTVRHFGVDYHYESRALAPTDPLPASLEWLRERCGVFAEVPPGDFAEILVTRYPPGAGIGYHRDAPMFGAKVVGVSLLSSCTMRFQRHATGVRYAYAIELEPRSAYILSGSARTAWQHAIPATKSLRYSITFRTLRQPLKG
jgi:DNA oxidative demethylase